MNIVCFSHIGWDFLFQRPQQIVSWLAKNEHSIIYVDPPSNLSHNKNVSVHKPTIQYITDLIYYLIVGILYREAVINRRLLVFTPVNYFGSKKIFHLLLMIFSLFF